MRRCFRQETPRGHHAAQGIYRKITSQHASAKPYALMADFTYSTNDQDKILKRLQSKWVDGAGDVYAAMINMCQIVCDEARETTLWKDAESAGLLGEGAAPSRLTGLPNRSERTLITERTMAIYRAGKFGFEQDASFIFEQIKERGLARQQDYEALLWGLKDYESQLAHWETMEIAGSEGGWTPSIDAFNAILWKLHQETKVEEMHQVLERIRELGLQPNDRTSHTIQRAGEKLRQLKMRDQGGPSWESRTVHSAPRLRVGL